MEIETHQLVADTQIVGELDSTSNKPYVGMEFDSLHQAFLFYNEYAAILGFSVRKDKTRKSNVDGSYLFRRFCCSKQGFPRNTRDNTGFIQIRDGVPVKVELRIPPAPRVTRRAKIEMKKRAEVLQNMRVGCNARLDVKRSSNGKWVVHKFLEGHNHECVSLGETHLLRSHRGRHVTQEGQEPASSSEELHSQYIELNCVQPSVGMEFESHHKAFLFYNAYARVLGFVVRKDKTRKSNIDGSLLFRRFCCSKEGYRRKICEDDNKDRKEARGGIVVQAKPRILPVTRVGCNARMEVKKTSDGKWVVQKFIEEHNHEFDRLGDMSLLRSQKQIQSTQAHVLAPVTNEDSSTSQQKQIPLFREASASEKVSSGKPRFRNRTNKRRKKKLEKGDLQVIFSYFRQRQSEDPSFFYAVHVDEDDQLLNCFWTDARSRLDFGYFGDVIFFETNYGSCQYGRPFVPIFGVNHHLQIVLFGCAIILNDSEESLTWLLETFLKAMRGRCPIRIITDQDEEMQKAIDRVLPGTRHCLSSRYIFHSASKNLSHLYNDEVEFDRDFKRCIYESQTPDEFETKWASLLDQYHLCDNEWLEDIYSKRHKWVPTYSKHIFQADMMTAQRSESLHSFFDDYLNRSLSFKEFVNQYEKALVDTREKESYEDLESNQVRHILKSDLPMEKQAADIYTWSMFKEFHKEFCDSFNYVAVETDSVETKRTFLVSRWGENSNCVVSLHSCSDICVSCSCQYFESMGILCRHILKVFTETNIMLVPDVYLKKRWTKRAKRGIVSDDRNKEMQLEDKNSIAFRYTELCHLALNICAKGAISLKAYQIAKSNILDKIRALEKNAGEDTDIRIDQHNLDTARISRPLSEVNVNSTSSEHLVTEGNHMLSVASQVGFYDPPRVQLRTHPLDGITPSVGETQTRKKARMGPDTTDDMVPSQSRRGVVELNNPCNIGGGAAQESENHRLLTMCPNICVYACPPGPSSDLNGQYHSSENAGFGETFADLPCIQSSEPNIFDLNQDVTVGTSSLTCSQTSHLDLNQMNPRPSDSWQIPSSGYTKLNFGGTSKQVVGLGGGRVGGFGGTVSVSDGSVVKAYAGPAGEVELVDSEILGLYNGLKILLSLQSSSPVWIEGDSQLVIKWLRRDGCDIPWRFTPLFFDIESIMSRLILGRITHVCKEANSVAGKLANQGMSTDSLTIWDQIPNL
ncbi:aspartate transaminase [Ranunculus cassubicifolius]